MTDISVLVNENVSHVVVSPLGDAISVSLNESVNSHLAQVAVTAENVTVNVTDAIDQIAVSLAPLQPPITVNVSEAGLAVGVGAVFITDIVPVSGVVGTKVFTEDGKELLSCSTDNDTVRLVIAAEGSGQDYTPVITVNDIEVAITESATKRWFTGTIDVPVANGLNTIEVKSSAGTTTQVDVNRRGAGPAVLTISIGAYPNGQTELKAGDVVPVTITTEPDAVSVSISASSTCDGATFAVIGGVATGNIVIGAGNAPATFTAIARNDFGTPGTPKVSPVLALNQTHPTIGAFTVTYPAGQGAIQSGQSADVSVTVTNGDVITYLGTGLDVVQGYAPTKTVQATSSAYVVSGSNYTVVATRVANGATSTASTLVRLATAAPTAVISTVPAGRMVSSPAGTDYEVRITPDQIITATPSLTASVGTWQGAWQNMGSYWRRNLRIFDSNPRGPATFSGLSLTSLSLVAGSSISSGANYTVGGISSRTLTFSAFSRVAAIGAQVSDQTKTTAAVVGGNTLTRQTSTAVVANGFYIADANGAYNPTGTYLGLSDTAFAGANTSGTLQVTFAEAA